MESPSTNTNSMQFVSGNSADNFTEISMTMATCTFMNILSRSCGTNFDLNIGRKLSMSFRRKRSGHVGGSFATGQYVVEVCISNLQAMRAPRVDGGVMPSGDLKRPEKTVYSCEFQKQISGICRTLIRWGLVEIRL